MCSLTFVGRDDGYVLAMNRDELTSRGVALPPTLTEIGGVSAVYPRDGAGGTWIAANRHGIALALLNWNDVPQPGAPKGRSRGVVIPYLIQFAGSRDIQEAIGKFDLGGIWPFRLVGVIPAEKKILEWQWSSEKLEVQHHGWESRHWFSSSLSDKQAAAARGAACENAWDEGGCGSLHWLRKLHASHANGPGPFSVCVHRENVETLSYTEFDCTPGKLECRYFSGSPCVMLATGGPSNGLTLHNR